MKFPFDFSIAFVFRLILPGMVLAGALTPLSQVVVRALGYHASWTVAYPVEAVFIGWLIVLCDQPIYMLYEGRRFWPKALWEQGVRLEQKRLDQLLERTTPAAEQSNPRIFMESLGDTLGFPLSDDGVRTALYPTRLGNLLTAYETYSDRYYGIDAIFYWHRLWMVLDKELRSDIDNAQALADSALYMAFALAVSSFVFVSYASVDVLFLYTGSIGFVFVRSYVLALALAVNCLVASYIVYRVGLYSQAQYGELFKSLFDQFRQRLSFADDVAALATRFGNDPTPARYNAREKYRSVSRLLDFNLIWPAGKDTPLTPEAWKQEVKDQRPSSQPKP